jgi:hypothetical protein
MLLPCTRGPRSLPAQQFIHLVARQVTFLNKQSPQPTASALLHFEALLDRSWADASFTARELAEARSLNLYLRWPISHGSTFLK